METWICDSCGGLIEKPDDGWVEWISLGSSKLGRDIRLVHKFGAVSGNKKDRCMFNGRAEFAKDGGTVADNSLTGFLGTDGLMRLLVFISESELPTPDVLEMIKRLHIPGYEQARKHFKEAINAGVFEPNMPERFYGQSDINATIKFISNQ
jgi:hypothetical protein